MNSIISPTIDLFIYDLRNSLDDTKEKISKNREFFLEKIPGQIRQELLEESEQDFDVGYVYLLKNRYATFKSQQKPVDGYYYPVRLGDTYGLIVECTFPDKNQVKLPKDFAELKAEIEQRLKDKTPTIGQTWVISGYLPQSVNTPEEIEEIAAACYQILMPNLNWEQELDGKGYFLGATIFELSSQRLAKRIVEIQAEKTEIVIQDSHVIIILYPNESSLNLSGKFYSDWMRLFYYRHKIIWAYGQSQMISSSLKTDFSKIQSESNNITLSEGRNLNNIRQTLLNIQKILNEYTIKLNILDFQTGPIDTNLSNYQKRLEIINQKAKEKTTATTDLKFLAEFSKLVNDKYLLQIKKDSENFGRGLRLLENTNNAVRSQVEVEKAKSDRNFQDIVAVVGSGIATVSLLKESKNECKFLLQVPAKKESSPCGYPLFYSLLLAIIVALGVWWLRKRLL